MIQKQGIAIADKRERMTATPQSPFLQSDLQGTRVADNFCEKREPVTAPEIAPETPHLSDLHPEDHPYRSRIFLVGRH